MKTTKSIKFQEIKRESLNEDTLRWYQYSQNNSGGYFTEPAQYVWVQGLNNRDIVCRFEALDLDTGYCECCGERWDAGPYSDDCLTEEPMHYSKKLTELNEDSYSSLAGDIPFGLLVFADGATQEITFS